MQRQTCGICGRAVMMDWCEEGMSGDAYHPKCLKTQELYLARQVGGIRPATGFGYEILITEKREVTR